MTSVHLLVLIHGMWGNPDHLAEMKRMVEEIRSEAALAQGTRLEVLLPETNREDSTYDGIDWCGERVAKEVSTRVKELEEAGTPVTKLSVTGYSLGGLIARYFVGILHQQGFFDKVQPANFNTVATPHIGLPKYDSFISSTLAKLGQRMLSRTGEQFYCADKWSPNGRPLLVVMADPDRIFYQALSRFQHIRIYANAVRDMTVPYVTAAIELEDPFVECDTNGVKLIMNEKYDSNLIESYTLPDDPDEVARRLKESQPERFSGKWFRSLAPGPPRLPPALQFRFPFNYMMYLAIPVVLPPLLTLVYIRVKKQSRLSQERIKLLESDDKEQRLAHLLAELEREVEEAVAELVEDETATMNHTVPILKPKAHPVLSTQQKKIVAWLNSLPGLKKELAYFPDAANAHGMVICRDIKRFPSHKPGQSVLRHWADSLIL